MCHIAGEQSFRMVFISKQTSIKKNNSLFSNFYHILETGRRHDAATAAAIIVLSSTRNRISLTYSRFHSLKQFTMRLESRIKIIVKRGNFGGSKWNIFRA